MAKESLGKHQCAGGLVPAQVEAARAEYPLALHCVDMNLGGSDPLDLGYLGRVRDLRDRCEAAVVSDHLCFTAVDGRNYHDLLPSPYTCGALRQVFCKIGWSVTVALRTDGLEFPAAFPRRIIRNCFIDGLRDRGARVLDECEGTHPDCVAIGFSSLESLAIAEQELERIWSRLEPLEVELPNLGLGERPMSLGARGLDVQLWVEKRILFAVIRK